MKVTEIIAYCPLALLVAINSAIATFRRRQMSRSYHTVHGRRRMVLLTFDDCYDNRGQLNVRGQMGDQAIQRDGRQWWTRDGRACIGWDDHCCSGYVIAVYRSLLCIRVLVHSIYSCSHIGGNIVLWDSRSVAEKALFLLRYRAVFRSEN